jgi:hypothetical protein
MISRVVKLYILFSILLSLCLIVLIYKPPRSITRELYTERQVYYFSNGGHYGDHILNLKFFYNISEHLKQNNIFIVYYYSGHVKNVGELERYVDKECVELEISYTDVNSGSVNEIWMRNTVDNISAWDNFSQFFVHLYSYILRTIKLDDKGIDTSLFQKEDYLLDIHEKLDDKFKNVDILMLNAEPQSGQLTAYNKGQFDELARALNQKYRIVTTSLVDASIPCSMEAGLALQDIGAISTHAKYVFGVNSGPLIPCFNSHAKANVRKWILLDNSPFKFDDINYSVSSTIPDINELLSQINIE